MAQCAAHLWTRRMLGILWSPPVSDFSFQVGGVGCVCVSVWVGWLGDSWLWTAGDGTGIPSLFMWFAYANPSPRRGGANRLGKGGCMGNAACNSIRGVAGHTHTTTRPHIDFSCENGCPAANWTIKDSHSPHCKLRPTVNNGNSWWCGWWLQGCAARVATETALAIAHIALIANFGSCPLRLYNYIYI